MSVCEKIISENYPIMHDKIGQQLTGFISALYLFSFIFVLSFKYRLILSG